MPLNRISITLPKDVLEAADKRARALDRSRSWVIVEAIRAYVAAPASQVREPAAPPYGVTSPGLGPLRLAQLESDLRLTPERRVRAAEENARLAERVRGSTGRGRSNRVLSFERYEDYVEWKRKDAASP
jgi:ribbon-helix-helix CopG family protein